ncbi:DUF3306 domain-containing protein [Caenimonas terrae]|uniref:DUF3306 domain-containing protein n=1 Tax=Caenimonas terrae TaxID=696074 RepID=A0ABW0NC84_9BURK
MADGFLGRWSRRKLDARDGKPLPMEPQPPPEAALAAAATEPAAVAPPAAAPAEAPAEAPPLTLDDAQALTAESDFRPFAARGVAPEVRNAAMKKLFSDPHFNVMDRLDTYIDDYSQPDPIPKSMLRQLASAKFLGLFDEEEKQEAEEAARRQAAAGREAADDPGAESVAQSAEPTVVPPSPDDDPDLRLQQDHAPPGKDPGGGAA